MAKWAAGSGARGGAETATAAATATATAKVALADQWSRWIVELPTSLPSPASLPVLLRNWIIFRKRESLSSVQLRPALTTDVSLSRKLCGATFNCLKLYNASAAAAAATAAAAAEDETRGKKKRSSGTARTDANAVDGKVNKEPESEVGRRRHWRRSRSRRRRKNQCALLRLRLRARRVRACACRWSNNGNNNTTTTTGATATVSRVAITTETRKK